jgi:hypothetical protein
LLLEFQASSIAGMKIQYPFRIILTGVLLLVLDACATYPKTGQAALAGTWTNSLGTVWTMSDDGAFTVDLNKDGKPDVWGRCTVNGDMVTIHETKASKTLKGCKGPATYKFSRPDKDSLQFTLVKDNCKLRKQNVLNAWHKK